MLLAEPFDVVVVGPIAVDDAAVHVVDDLPESVRLLVVLTRPRLGRD